MPRMKRELGDPAADAPGFRFTVLTWVTLGYNVIVNIGLPVLAYVFLIPYIVQQLTSILDLGPLRTLGNILHNNPIAVVLILPSAVLGLLFPLFGWSKFLLVYLYAETIAAWVEFSVGTLSVLACVYQLWMFAMYESHVTGASWLALIGGSFLIAQSVLMMISVIFSKIVYEFKVRASADSTTVLKYRARNSKLLACGAHAADVVLQVSFALLFAFLFFADKDLEIDKIGVFELVTNGLVFGNAILSLLVSFSAFVAILFVILFKSSSPVVSAVFGFVDLVICLLELLIFLALTFFVLGRTYLKFFETPESEIRATPLNEIFSFLILALFKVFPIVTSFECAWLQYSFHRKLVIETSKKKGGKYHMHKDVYKLSTML